MISVSLTKLTLNGETPLANESGFTYRPVTEGNGFFYMLSNNYLFKLRYNRKTKTFDQELVWAFRLPVNESFMQQQPSANAMIVNDLVCVATNPVNPRTSQHVYCVNKYSGDMVWDFQPFDANGSRSFHSLAALEDRNQLFTIVKVRNSDADGGIAGYDLTTGKKLWPNVNIANISQAYAIASGNRKLYTISQESFPGPTQVHVVDLVSGSSRVLTELTSELFEGMPLPIKSLPPQASLHVMGSNGNLYITWPHGTARIQDKKCAEVGC